MDLSLADEAGPRTETLLARTSSPNYFMRAHELIQQLPAAQEPADALEILRDATRRLGADVSAFVSFLREDDSHESFRFLLACDPVWCFRYEELCWYADDPWLSYALTNTEPICGSELTIRPGRQAEVIELARQFGFRSTVIVPAPCSGGLSRLGLLCLGSGQDRYFEAEGYLALKVVARSLAMELHDWWISRLRRELLEDARINDDELVLLRSEREGRSSKAIAQALDLTPTAIDTRFQRLNAKLGVANRKAAARLAAEYGLI